MRVAFFGSSTSGSKLCHSLHRSSGFWSWSEGGSNWCFYRWQTRLKHGRVLCSSFISPHHRSNQSEVEFPSFISEMLNWWKSSMNLPTPLQDAWECLLRVVDVYRNAFFFLFFLFIKWKPSRIYLALCKISMTIWEANSYLTQQKKLRDARILHVFLEQRTRLHAGRYLILPLLDCWCPAVERSCIFYQSFERPRPGSNLALISKMQTPDNFLVLWTLESS